MGKAATKKRTVSRNGHERQDALWIATDEEARAAIERRKEMITENIKKRREAIADLEVNRLFDHLNDGEDIKEAKKSDAEQIQLHLKAIDMMQEALKDIERRLKASAKLLRAFGPKDEGA